MQNLIIFKKKKKIKRSLCDARFDIYILIRQKRFLFFMLIARKKHTYHSSYFIKLLQQIANDVIATIKQ